MFERLLIGDVKMDKIAIEFSFEQIKKLEDICYYTMLNMSCDSKIYQDAVEFMDKFADIRRDYFYSVIDK